MFEWKKEYAVNIASIDAQHQGLFSICRELAAAMSAGKGNIVLAGLLDRLVQYTVAHFKHDEGLLKFHKHPDFAQHKAQHDDLTKPVVAFQTEFKAGRAVLAIELLKFLPDWLAQHIQKSDFAYAPCLKAQKIA